MNLLLRGVTVVDSNSKYNQKLTDLFIKDGIISAFGKKIKIEGKFKEIDCKGLFISPGWFDMQVSFCDPGFEHKEDIESGVKAAAAGGFTGVAVLPDTHPALHSKSEIEYILNRAKGKIVDVHALGAITRKCEGKELAEIYDMHHAGAVAYSDASNPVTDSGVMMRALQYVKLFDGVVFSHPDDVNVSHEGSMNEGVMSTNLGLKGMPSLAEELMVVRDIYLAEYTQSRVHFSLISTARSVDLIRAAKKKGVKVTCGVSSMHLFFDDKELAEFDTNFKLDPPLRTKEDVTALKAGLKDGTIDVIVSAHQPQNIELKDVEFEYADFGAINLQTSFALANSSLGKNNSLETIIEKISINPRKILGLKIQTINENEEANFTLFNSNEEWSFSKEKNKSKSGNTPMFGKKLNGRVFAVFNHNQFIQS
ncbi:dihydroorotase [Bacteroidota bacterium]|nr:dihydroorotase [Bacteroidota bacterium]